MRIESKRMLKGLFKWYKTVVYQDTEYYSVTDLTDGGRMINLLPDSEGRVFRVILSKEDIERIFLGKEAIEAKKVHKSSPHQNQRPVMLPPSNPEQGDDAVRQTDFLAGLVPRSISIKYKYIGKEEGKIGKIL